MIYSLGVSWSTTAAVEFTGGATISVNEGSIYLDLMESTATQATNWSPTIQYTYPVFSTAATVSFIPIMRSSLSIGVNIMNAPYGAQPVYITSASAIGFNAALIESGSGACPAGELMMTSYSNVANSVLFTGQASQALGPSGNLGAETMCFNVPNDIPTVDEVNSLRGVGAAFCTSYLDYSPSTTVAYTVTTVTTPSMIPTIVATTISTTTTMFSTTTVTTIFTLTSLVNPTSYVSVTGTQSLGTHI